MGKKLIIIGADFSINAVPVGQLIYVNNYSDAILNGEWSFSSAEKWYMMPASVTRLGLQEHTIRVVKMYAKSSGIVTIGKYLLGSGTTVLDEYSYQVEQGINIIDLRVPLDFTTTYLPYIGGQGIWALWGNSNDDYGWSINRSGQQASQYAHLRVPVSFGYYG